MRRLSFLRSKSRVSWLSTFAVAAALRVSAMSICASTDLLSQPLAMILFYACSGQIESWRTIPGRRDAEKRAICHSICYALPRCNFSYRRSGRDCPDAPTRHPPGSPRSLFQHLVDFRPPEWRWHEALDGEGEQPHRVCPNRRQGLPDHGTRAAALRGAAADAAGGHADANHL